MENLNVYRHYFRYTHFNDHVLGEDPPLQLVIVVCSFAQEMMSFILIRAVTLHAAHILKDNH